MWGSLESSNVKILRKHLRKVWSVPFMIQHINACQSRTPREYEPICIVCTIFAERNDVVRNGVVRFMTVQYGMKHFSELVEVDLSLEKLRELLDNLI